MQTGLMLMPMAVVMGVMMPINGRLFDKVGALPLCLTGLLITAVTTYQLHAISYDISFREMQWLLVKRGFGLGLCMSLTTAGMNSVPHFLIGRASALNNLVRQISASLGIAFLTYVILNRQAYHAAVNGDAISQNSLGSVEMIESLQLLGANSSGAQWEAVPEAVLSGLAGREAFITGISDAFTVSAGIILLAVPFVFLLGKKQVESARALDYKRFAHLTPSGGMPQRKDGQGGLGPQAPTAQGQPPGDVRPG